MLEIDGSQKSGSGTIVRYSIAFASLLGKNLNLKNIRAKREKPGLRPQHLRAIQACAEMTKGSLEGAVVGSSEIFYKPGKIIFGGKYSFDIGTAGSTTMLTQTILPLACFANSSSHFLITGGLFQDFAPAAHHLQHVIFPLLGKMGIIAKLKVKRPGYVPTGEGIIELHVEPVKELKPLQLTEQGDVNEIKGVSLSSHLEDREVSERMAKRANQVLKKFGLDADIEIIYDTSALQRGASLTLYLTTSKGCIIGADMAGKHGRTSELIGHRVSEMLLEDLHKKATVDRHTADQLILYAALASGNTQYIIPKMTDHIETNLWLIDEILQAKSTLEDQNLLNISGINFSK